MFLRNDYIILSYGTANRKTLNPRSIFFFKELLLTAWFEGGREGYT